MCPKIYPFIFHLLQNIYNECPNCSCCLKVPLISFFKLLKVVEVHKMNFDKFANNRVLEKFTSYMDASIPEYAQDTTY